MPQIDLPLEKLFAYEGISPKPADFDEYWDRAIAEMRSVDPKIELVPAQFQVPFAECFHLYFTGVRGARIHAKYIRPKEGKNLIRLFFSFTAYRWTREIGKTKSHTPLSA